MRELESQAGEVFGFLPVDFKTGENYLKTSERSAIVFLCEEAWRVWFGDTPNGEEE